MRFEPGVERSVDPVATASSPDAGLLSSGDKVPRKGGPGVTQFDLLIVNKTDLAPHVGADLGVMAHDAAAITARPCSRRS